MADPTGEQDRDELRFDFGRRLMPRPRGSVITSAGGPPAYRELDAVLALARSGGEVLAVIVSGAGDGTSAKCPTEKELSDSS